jgi:hypothetical protein
MNSRAFDLLSIVISLEKVLEKDLSGPIGTQAELPTDAVRTNVYG